MNENIVHKMEFITDIANMKKHDPDSPFLIGNSMPLDRVHEADQYSYIKDQVEMEI